MLPSGLLEKDITGHIIGAFFEVYRTLGFGFLEQIYILALQHELEFRGQRVRREVGVPVRYKGHTLATQRIDMLVDEKVVVEIKSSAILPATSQRQILNYLRATNLEVALLLHFGPDAKFYRMVHSRHGENSEPDNC